MRANKLQWFPQLGLGYLPPGEGFDYGDQYFEHYASIADSEIGRQLNAARVAMLGRHRDGYEDVVDVGIGAGTFVEAAGVNGYDVNPRGVEWLKARDLYRDPYAAPVEVRLLLGCAGAHRESDAVA